MFKKLFNFLFKENKKIILNEDAYFNYLISGEDKNNYSFEEKYVNQEKNLYKIYGKSKQLNSKIKLIIITDTHNCLNEINFENFIDQHIEYDACLLLGDFGTSDLDIILKYIDKNKIYALLGNHDYNYIDNYKLNNLNGNVIEINGIKLLGIQGSFKYKPTDFPSFSQRDSIIFLNDKPQVDILVSHDMGFNSNATNNPSHQGLFGITYYLYKNKVPYNIHGHIHNSYKKYLLNGTCEISAYMYEYVELPIVNANSIEISEIKEIGGTFMNCLTRDELLNIDGIWNRDLDKYEYYKMLVQIELKMNNYEYENDVNYLINSRRQNCINEINQGILNQKNIADIVMSFWEFMSDEYGGCMSTDLSEIMNKPVYELDEMDNNYRRKRIICLKEKEDILNLINKIKMYIGNNAFDKDINFDNSSTSDFVKTDTSFTFNKSKADDK